MLEITPPVPVAQATVPVVSFASYQTWRRTKCPPDFPVRDAILNAALGLCGELAEVASVVGRPLGPGDRDKLIDECGDLVFYTMWTLDAWGYPADLPVGGGNGRRTDNIRTDAALPFSVSPLPWVAKGGADGPAAGVPGEIEAFAVAARTDLDAAGLLIDLLRAAGGIAERAKKQVFHDVPSGTEVGRLAVDVLRGVVLLLRLVGSSLSEAVNRNVEKLDRRYPEGWVPGGGQRSAAASGR